jgi:hypothetical protein
LRSGVIVDASKGFPQAIHEFIGIPVSISGHIGEGRVDNEIQCLTTMNLIAHATLTTEVFNVSSPSAPVTSTKNLISGPTNSEVSSSDSTMCLTNEIFPHAGWNDQLEVFSASITSVETTIQDAVAYR